MWRTSRGSFQWRPGLPVGYEMYPLGINLLEILVQGIRSRMPIDTMRTALAGKISSPMSVVTDRRLNLDGLNLTGRELGIVASIREGTTIGGLIGQSQGSRVSESDIVRVVFILDSTGLVRFETGPG